MNNPKEMKTDGKPLRTCLELAQEGERLCRENNFSKGVDFLLKALNEGTDDTNALSAIYSQLGNAYFSLRRYEQALEYHMHDVLLTRFTGDTVGELKACANVGHTFKAIGMYEDAILFTKSQLDLSRQCEEKSCEARALYNLGTIYQLRSRTCQKNPEGMANNSYLQDVQLAVQYYKDSLRLSEELRDVLGCGRIYGNLGNAYYMLREFQTAIDYHYKRLDTARQFGDKGAMRRAYTSLANAHVFLPDMDKAIEFYRLALSIAVDVGDRLAEAQSCFSLANAASLVSDYQTAVEFHERHLELARSLDDRAGQARAYSSLASDFRGMGENRKALYFLVMSRRMAREMHEDAMLNSANDAIREIIRDEWKDDSSELRVECPLTGDGPPIRLSHSLRSLHDDDDDCGLTRQLFSESDLSTIREDGSRPAYSQDDFFEMLSRMQSKRLDEQRCDPVILSDLTNQTNIRQTDQLHLSPGDGPDAIMDMIMSMQGRRMEEQRASLLPGLSDQRILQKLHSESRSDSDIDEHLYELVLKAQQQRLEEQRSELGGKPVESRPTTIPEDDISELISRMQMGRMEEQRAHLAAPEEKQETQ